MDGVPVRGTADAILDEINAASQDTPVFVLHLYDRALLNGAALRAVEYTKSTPPPPGGEIQRDRHGNPTGLLLARPNAMILYSTPAKGPKLSREDQMNCTRLFRRELNRFGITSVVDDGGGFQNYPDDYGVVHELHQRGSLPSAAPMRTVTASFLVIRFLLHRWPICASYPRAATMAHQSSSYRICRAIALYSGT